MPTGPSGGNAFDEESIEGMNEAAKFMRTFAFDTMKAQNKNTKRPLIGTRRSAKERSLYDTEYIRSPFEMSAQYDEMAARARLGTRFPVPKEWWDELKQIGKEQRR